MRPRSGTITPLLAPAALAVLLAVFAAMLARRHDDEARRLAEDRARLCLSLAAQTELRIEQLRGAFDAATDNALESPHPEDLAAKLLASLQARDAAFTHLALFDTQGRPFTPSEQPAPGSSPAIHGAFHWLRDALGASPGTTVGGLYPASDGTGRLLFSRAAMLSGQFVHLRAEADTASLPALAAVPPRSIALIVTSSGTLLQSAAAQEQTVPAEAVVDAASKARKASGLVRRSNVPADDAQYTILAAPMPGSPLVLALITPDDSGGGGISSTALLLLAGGVLASLLPQILRRAKK